VAILRSKLHHSWRGLVTELRGNMHSASLVSLLGWNAESGVKNWGWRTGCEPKMRLTLVSQG
jgi:hypothetical protein